MRPSIRQAALALICFGTAASALAQSGPAGTQSSATTQQPASSAQPDTRPATTTFLGDTGLWFVPTAEVVPAGKWSVSGYRRGTNFIQGYTNVADFAGTFAFGVKDHAEIFGSFLVDTRIDRDVRPIFTADPTYGGVISRYPFVHQGWTGDNVGDFYVGVKFNLMSEYQQKPAAVAVRAMVKLPTGGSTSGTSTGKADWIFDFIASKDIQKKVEFSGTAGWEFDGSPDNISAPGGAFRWGAGAGFPSHSPLRVTAELNGLVPSASTVTLSGPSIVGSDGSIAPLTSNIENLTRATIGLTWQSPKGFFIGGGFSWNVPTQARNLAQAQDDPSTVGDYWDYQVRIGYHPGVRVYVPPPPPQPEPAKPVEPANRPPTVHAQCDPCTVQVGQPSTVTADARDPDGDVLTYRWSAPSGSLANPSERQTTWTAPAQEGTVPVTVTVSDGKGGTATDTVNIQVVRPPRKEYTFEDVHFDFDRYTLRPEATRLLDEAVRALQENPELQLTIEGHTCNIGTAEYNLALGDRRANAVRDYLTSRGVPASRLRTISYGEERPKYDNAREETRRLNRRAALVVRLQ